MKWLVAFALVVISSGPGFCSPTLGDDASKPSCGGIECTDLNSDPFGSILKAIEKLPDVDTGKYVCVDLTSDITDLIPTQAPITVKPTDVIPTQAPTEKPNKLGDRQATVEVTDLCAKAYKGDKDVCDLLKDAVGTLKKGKIEDCTATEASGAYKLSASLLISSIFVLFLYQL